MQTLIFFSGLDGVKLTGRVSVNSSWLLEVLLRQKPLETDVVGVAVDWGLVGTGLDLFWFLGGERVGSTGSDVDLQLQQDLEGILKLHFTVEAGTERNNPKTYVSLAFF